MVNASKPRQPPLMDMESQTGVAPNQGRHVSATDKNILLKKGLPGVATPRDNSPKTTVADESGEESSQEGNDTDFESESDGDEEQPEADEVKENSVAFRPNSKSGVDVSGKPSQNSGQDGKINLSTVPPALLGEIRRMIQQEFGTIKTSVIPEQPKNDQHEAEQHQLEGAVPVISSTLWREPATRKVRPRALSISPRQRYTEPTTGSPASSVAAPASPERLVVVRFADDVPKLSALDEKWGSLFDNRGVPTRRLEQVLRGLANYIIDEFMPQRSIVVPPEKMAAFYSLHKLESEIYPFIAIFKCRTKGWNVALEDMYQDLGCEYHLIQKDPKSRPNVPALTPAGFAKWITTNILAYPDAEAKRLNKVVSELPINADSPADGIPERLPKQVSRHLLPDKHDRKARRLFDDVMRDFVEEFLPSSAVRSQTQQRVVSSKVDAVPEKRGSNSSASGSSPRSSKHPYPLSRTESTPSPRTNTFDEQDRDRGTHKSTRDNYDKSHDSSSTVRRDSPPRPPPIGRLGRANSEHLSLTTGKYTTNNNTNTTATSPLPPPPVGSGRPTLAASRRRSSPNESYNRRSDQGVLPPSPTGDVIREIRDREAEYQYHAPRVVVGDYTPRSSAGLGVSVPRRGEEAVPRRSEVGAGGNPGPTWDQYLTGRQGGSPRGSTVGGYARGSV